MSLGEIRDLEGRREGEGVGVGGRECVMKMGREGKREGEGVCARRG